jgi:hypothetical protein
MAEDKDLWDSALTEEPAEEVQVEEVQQEQPEPEQPVVARDEHGRFAPKPEAEPEKVKAEEPERGPPAWRLKEEADARRSAEQRAAQLEQQLQQFMRQQEQAKAPPDIFENPGAFVDQGVRTAVDPIKQEIGQLREFYSQREAVKEHGAEKVQAAYEWMKQGMQSRDPERMAIYQRAMASFDPYGDIVGSHLKHELFQQIGTDPSAYVEKQLEERLKDPAYQAKLLERIRSATQARPNATTTQLPPSLGRVSSGLPRAGDEDDDSEAGLFRQATR